VVIVGAGSAGGVIAARLAERSDVTVALVEAGPDYPELEVLPDELKYGRATAAYVATHGHLWSYTATATSVQEPTPLPRGKVVGGTSAVNGQIFLRAVRSDFERWTAAGNSGWDFDSVLPAYKRIESDLDFQNEWHGNDGPIRVRRYRPDEWLPPQDAFVAACRDAGHGFCDDANEPDATGVGPLPFNNVDGLRASTLTTYLAAARRQDNLTIFPDTFARRLLVDRDRIVGVEVAVGTTPTTLVGDVFVVSAGAIGSPCLLLHSGLGPAGRLERLGIACRQDLDGVGKGLADHQVADLVWAVGGEHATHDGPVPRVQVALRYSSTSGVLDDDMQITIRNAAPGHSDDTVSLVPALELPSSTGELTLVSDDPEIAPRIDLRFLSDPVDLARLREGVQLCLELADTAVMRGCLAHRIEPVDADVSSDAAVDAWLMQRVRTSHHVCGTCRMGPAEDGGVVGGDARVHGLENLYVADASIFPTVIAANLNATTLMIGERVAELVGASLG
jgi:choline dehydrogenase